MISCRGTIRSVDFEGWKGRKEGRRGGGGGRRHLHLGFLHYADELELVLRRADDLLDEAGADLVLDLLDPAMATSSVSTCVRFPPPSLIVPFEF